MLTISYVYTTYWDLFPPSYDFLLSLSTPAPHLPNYKEKNSYFLVSAQTT